jgi:hypothetical protein
MNPLVKDMLQKYQCPLVNSIIFPSGDLLVLEKHGDKVRVICESTVDSYFKYNPDDYVCDFDIFSTCTDERFCAHAGEGSWGDDGIIYLTDFSKEHLIWFIFFDNSNPFDKVTIHEDKVIAHSTSGKVWSISIQDPTRIDISDIPAAPQ